MLIIPVVTSMLLSVVVAVVVSVSLFAVVVLVSVSATVVLVFAVVVRTAGRFVLVNCCWGVIKELTTRTHKTATN